MALRGKRWMGAFAGVWLAVSLGIVAAQGSPDRAGEGAAAESAAVPVPLAELVLTATPPIAEVEPVEPPPLVLCSINGGDTEVLNPERDDGGFSTQDLQRAAIAFSQQSPGKVHPVAPRLLDLVYRTMRHFEADVVHVVSGYRRDRAGSRHTQGRAVDMRLDGVANEQLAEYVREFGFVGVGLYPKSGFVHLDVREASYFWIDRSAPGARSRLIPVLAEQARSADAAARARGETPDLFVPNNRAEDRAANRVYARPAPHRRARARGR